MGIKAALQGANSFVHAIAVLQGLESSEGDELVLDNMGNRDPSDDITVPIAYGYLDADNVAEDDENNNVIIPAQYQTVTTGC